MMICLITISCFSGYSLVTKDSKAEQQDDIITVDEKTLTTKDIINSFYSFYQQNQYYFMYNDTDVVMDSFYNSIISREVVMQEARKLLNNGTIALTDEDYMDAWYSVFDYFHDNVDSYEKKVYSSKDIDKDNEKYPSRFKDEDDKDKEIIYKGYTFEPVISYTKGTQGRLKTIDEMIDALNNFVKTKYLTGTVDDDHPRDTMIADIPAEELSDRSVAFDKYIANLMLSAKVNGDNYNKDVAYREEIERVLKVYEENALYNEYKEYICAQILSSEEDKLSDKAIVEKYLDLLGKDSEKYETLANYTKVISSTDNESMIMYHNGNEGNKYFSVQHLLIKFDDDSLTKLKQDAGYSTDVDIMLRQNYEDNVRAAIATSLQSTKGIKARNAKTGLEFDKEREYTANDILNLYNTLSAGKTGEEKIDIFNKLTWEFTEDTSLLVNDKLKGVLGFAISSENYEHGSLVKDFTNGARELYEEYKTTNQYGTIKFVVSDYGIHIMMLTGVYDEGPVADVVYTAGEVNIAATIANLKNAKVSNLTNQTIYEYVYDQLKNEYLGDNGTYFSSRINKLVKEYRDSGKIKYEKDRPTYDELMEALKG